MGSISDLLQHRSVQIVTKPKNSGISIRKSFQISRSAPSMHGYTLRRVTVSVHYCCSPWIFWVAADHPGKPSLIFGGKLNVNSVVWYMMVGLFVRMLAWSRVKNTTISLQCGCRTGPVNPLIGAVITIPRIQSSNSDVGIV